jgi:hypothetical protein
MAFISDSLSGKQSRSARVASGSRKAIEYHGLCLRTDGVKSSPTATHSSWLRKTGLSAPRGLVGMICSYSAVAAVLLSALVAPDSYGRSTAAGL